RPRHEENHGSALPVLRKDTDERPPRQPRPQRHEPQVARESEEHPCGRRRRATEGLRLHALHPIREDHEGEPEDEAGRLIPGFWFLVSGFSSLVRPLPPETRNETPETYSRSPAFGTLYFRMTSRTPVIARMRPRIFSSCFRSDVSSDTLT